MKFSVAKEIITPDWPMRMAGYGSRVKPNEGVYDQLYTMALLLDDGNNKVLIVTIDVCMIDRGYSYEVKERIHAKYGLKPENIILHAIHTHAGPVTIPAWLEKGTKDYDDCVRFRNLLAEKIEICAGRCMTSQKEGYIEIGTGETYIGMNRRQKMPDGVRIGPNPYEEIDRLTYALTIKNTEGKTEVVIFSCPCHPVVLYPRNMKISADFPGAARAELEKKFPGAQAMFLQNACADINPAVLVADDDYRDTYYSDVLFTGRILANDVANIIGKGMRRLNVSIASVSEKVILPLDGDPIKEPKPYDWNMVMGEIQATIIKLADDFRFVCLDGEICNQIGVHIRELFSNDTMVMGYTDGWVGYIPTPKILMEGGYESRCTEFDRKYAMNAEEVLLNGLKSLGKRIDIA